MKIDGFCHPAPYTVGKGRGFYKFSPHFEFPAVDAEPAMFDRFPFLREALYASPHCREFTKGIGSHGDCLLLYPYVGMPAYLNQFRTNDRV